MRKILIAPDSFKGTLTASEVCAAVSASATAVFPECSVISLPIADGGEGSVDCVLAACGGARRRCIAAGPLFAPIEAYYGRLADGSAIVETAACAGLSLMREPSPITSTTYGVGELILNAAQNGAKRIVVGLGGSVTNDGGCGMAAALGVRFYKRDGAPFVPVGGTLGEIARIDVSEKSGYLSGVEIIAMCDVKNPLYGSRGAAHIFGPQKGASPADVEALDAGLRNLAAVVRSSLGLDAAELPGAGAAGGMGYGMHVFLNARLQSGVDTVLDLVCFDELVRDADLVVTGEGKLDAQSGMGKAVGGVAARAGKAGVPVIAFVGGVEGDDALTQGPDAVFTINRLPQPLSESAPQSGENLRKTARQVFRLIRIFEAREAKKRAL